MYQLGLNPKGSDKINNLEQIQDNDVLVVRGQGVTPVKRGQRENEESVDAQNSDLKRPSNAFNFEKIEQLQRVQTEKNVPLFNQKEQQERIDFRKTSLTSQPKRKSQSLNQQQSQKESSLIDVINSLEANEQASSSDKRIKTIQLLDSSSILSHSSNKLKATNSISSQSKQSTPQKEILGQNSYNKKDVADHHKKNSIANDLIPFQLQVKQIQQEKLQKREEEEEEENGDLDNELERNIQKENVNEETKGDEEQIEYEEEAQFEEKKEEDEEEQHDQQNVESNEIVQEDIDYNEEINEIPNKQVDKDQDIEEEYPFDNIDNNPNQKHEQQQQSHKLNSDSLPIPTSNKIISVQHVKSTGDAQNTSPMTYSVSQTVNLISEKSMSPQQQRQSIKLKQGDTNNEPDQNIEIESLSTPKSNILNSVGQSMQVSPNCKPNQIPLTNHENKTLKSVRLQSQRSQISQNIGQKNLPSEVSSSNNMSETGILQNEEQKQGIQFRKSESLLVKNPAEKQEEKEQQSLNQSLKTQSQGIPPKGELKSIKNEKSKKFPVEKKILLNDNLGTSIKSMQGSNHLNKQNPLFNSKLVSIQPNSTASQKPLSQEKETADPYLEVGDEIEYSPQQQKLENKSEQTFSQDDVESLLKLQRNSFQRKYDDAVEYANKCQKSAKIILRAYQRRKFALASKVVQLISGLPQYEQQGIRVIQQKYRSMECIESEQTANQITEEEKEGVQDTSDNKEDKLMEDQELQQQRQISLAKTVLNAEYEQALNNLEKDAGEQNFKKQGSKKIVKSRNSIKSQSKQKISNSKVITTDSASKQPSQQRQSMKISSRIAPNKK